ncbi:DUF4381 domain-containing protein [Thalassotalea psychrophila]|uniref:DUF4381 domain-containing protein n=1 Tax=Thalassotalea psychrophila TaxID=3065647 RepID=A0ABY9TZ73_9GAMM|nr:DUF4381 domain-containing protein [Colwelliaceae bacterium SQ149]
MRLFPEPWGNYLVLDIIETSQPDAISWWPTTIGWQLLFIIILLLAFKRIYFAIKHYQEDAYRRDALKCLFEIKHSRSQHSYLTHNQLPALLRASALHAFGRNDITQLSGKDWEEWLDQQCEQSNFKKNCSGILHQLSYNPGFEISPEQLNSVINEISLWLKFHRRLND